MGIWLDILKHAAEGNSEAARELLDTQLPLTLRDFVRSAQGTRQYTGPVPKAVARFIDKLPSGEQGQAKFFAYDLVDYIVDDVVAEVRRTLLLVELCYAQPNAAIDEIVMSFPWDVGLKRDANWKRQRVADILRSMLAKGISLPAKIAMALSDEGVPCYEFNEIAYAVAPRRLELSWWDFKREQGLDAEFVCVVESDTEIGSAAEGVDYGPITKAKTVLKVMPSFDKGEILDLHILGKSLGPELTTLTEEMHAAKPRDGYRPIAWHNVFWKISFDYEGLPLDLKLCDPFCYGDQKLADHIADNYREVLSTSRPVIVRRRKRLHCRCNKKILARIHERFSDRENR